jgi:uncharacterized protein (DUF305 family)
MSGQPARRVTDTRPKTLGRHVVARKTGVMPGDSRAVPGPRALIATAALTAILTGLTAGLTACGGADHDSPMHGAGMGGARMSRTATPPVTSAPSAAVDPRHNGADVRFDHMMVVHHESALAMADLAARRARTEDVRALAARIRAAQGPEIDEMTGWLTAWGLPAMVRTAMPMMGHGDVRVLDAAAGKDFDRRFLELMIPHHQEAVAMAQRELANGVNPQTLALARSIRSSQTAEIALMQKMLGALPQS